jgi:hypothetical protein
MNPHTKARIDQAVLETLEDRRLLSSIAFDNGLLTITGDRDARNLLTVRPNQDGTHLKVNRNGTITYHKRSQVKKVKVVGGIKEDVIYIDPGVHAGLSFNSDRGIDTIFAADGDDQLGDAWDNVRAATKGTQIAKALEQQRANPPSTSVLGVVQSLSLINADTDQVIAGYENITSGAILNLATLSTRNLSIRANASGGQSVRFYLSGAEYQITTESETPYAILGESASGYTAWTPETGSYKLTATPFGFDAAMGLAGTSKTVTFTVVDEATVPAAEPVEGPPIAEETPIAEEPPIALPTEPVGGSDPIAIEPVPEPAPEPTPEPAPAPTPTGTIIRAGSSIPTTVTGSILLQRGAVYETTGLILANGASIDATGDASLPMPVIRGTATGAAPELIKCQGNNAIRNVKLDSVTNDTYGIVVYGAGVTVQRITSTSRFARVVYNKEGSDVLFTDSTFEELNKFLLFVGGNSTGTTMRNVNLTVGNWWEAIVRVYGDNVLIEDCTWARPRFTDSSGTAIPLKGIAIRGGTNITLRRVTMTGNGGQVAIGGLDSESHSVENLTLEDCNFDVPQIYIRYGTYNVLIKGGVWKSSGSVIDIESVAEQPGRTAPTGRIEGLEAIGSSFIGGSSHKLTLVNNTLNAVAV